jgi:hypothetical protein
MEIKVEGWHGWSASRGYTALTHLTHLFRCEASDRGAHVAHDLHHPDTCWETLDAWPAERPELDQLPITSSLVSVSCLFGSGVMVMVPWGNDMATMLREGYKWFRASPAPFSKAPATTLVAGHATAALSSYTSVLDSSYSNMAYGAFSHIISPFLRPVLHARRGKKWVSGGRHIHTSCHDSTATYPFQHLWTPSGGSSRRVP